jgi:hypothetical protein
MIVARRLSRKRSLGILIVAARQLGIGSGCRAGRWPTAFAVEGGAAAVAFDIHLEDGDVVLSTDVRNWTLFDIENWIELRSSAARSFGCRLRPQCAADCRW